MKQQEGLKVSENQDMFVPVLDEKELQEGSMKLVKIEGIPVLLVKVSGEIYAIDNRCPHMGCGFSGGSLDGNMIICPCHDWRFDLKTGEYEEDKDMKLVKYEWKIESGKILVKVDDEEW
ncbi:MAG: Rieske (2Fe-2S) protein [Candidatus Bathyarchaeota archaeon]|nr:Rieske (2Fe-2S) protein [Candidatus Bathyarchaeota archaeon]